MVLFLGLVAADIVGQNSVSIGGMAILCVYIQSLSSVGDKYIPTRIGHKVGHEGEMKIWAGSLADFPEVTNKGE